MAPGARNFNNLHGIGQNFRSLSRNLLINLLIWKLFGSKFWTRDQEPGTRDQGPGTRDQGPGTKDRGPGTRDQGPGTRDRGPGTRDQGPGPQAEKFPWCLAQRHVQGETKKRCVGVTA